MLEVVFSESCYLKWIFGIYINCLDVVRDVLWSELLRMSEMFRKDEIVMIELE